MTRITSYTQLPTFEIAGNALNIYWDEQPVEPTEESPESAWSYKVCRAHAKSSRSALIEAIMAVDYPTFGSEIAAIQNGGDDAAAHQAARDNAKAIADAYLNPPTPQLLNVNTATKAELTALSGVGPTMAQAIIDGRAWSSINDLTNISGISQTMVDGWDVTV